jgi:SRSO17 transposase
MLLDETPMMGCIEDYRPIHLQIVNNTAFESLWNETVRKYHYLGFGKMIGQSVKYLAFAADRPIAAISYNRATLRVSARDVYIGWSDEGRHQYLSNIVCNHRFLIFPWIKVKNLASHILALSLRRLPSDWKNMHGNTPSLVETFVDAERYHGTCFLAANFKYIGETKGYGKQGHMFTYHGNKKKVFIYELDKRFIESIAPHLRRTVQPEYPEKTIDWVSTKMMSSMPDWNAKLFKSIGLTPEKLRDLITLFSDFINLFIKCFKHVAQHGHFVRYLIGLLSDSERKSIEHFTLKNGEAKHVRLLQRFISCSPMKDKELMETYQNIALEFVADDDGMITIDGCDFVKKGEFSPAVMRQHCGPMGKTDNCQATVMVGFSGSRGYALLGRALYVPLKWFDDDHKAKRKKCGIPPALKFKTKNQIAIELLQSLKKNGVYPGKWVGADSAFGHDTKFLDAIPRGLYYFVDIHKDDKFYLTMPEMVVPEWCGLGRKPINPKTTETPLKAESIIEQTDTSWKEVEFGIGSKGMIKGYEKVLRVVDIREGVPNKWVWLYAKMSSDKRTIKYMISNAPDDTTVEKLRELSLRRWAIEQCFEECKSELGMDHFEGRSWKGWHRHVLFVFIAHLFLQMLRRHFSAKVDQLSQQGKILFELKNPGKKDKAVILTTSMVRDVIYAVSKRDEGSIVSMLQRLAYTLKANARSFLSFCKKSSESIFNKLRGTVFGST